MSKIKRVYERNENGCLVCISHTVNVGHPYVYVNGKRMTARQYAYTQHYNELVEKDEQIIYTCGNLHCVEPTHLKKVKRGSPPKERVCVHNENGCLVCISHRPFSTTRYARQRYKGKSVHRSRIVYQDYYGDLGPNDVVRHTCDNPLCEEPTHLIKGTVADNSRDMVERGRSHKKLNIETVRLIRQDLAEGKPYKEIIRLRGTSKSNIGAIKRGITWKNIV